MSKLKKSSNPLKNTSKGIKTLLKNKGKDKLSKEALFDLKKMQNLINSFTGEK